VVLKVAARAAIPPFHAMEVLRAANERAAAGERVLHLEIGQPDSGAPAPVIEAAQRALTSHRLGYTEALGIGPLRQAIAGHYRRSYGLDMDPERIVVATGSSGAFLLSFLAAFEPGDRVALAAPGYPAYRNILLALGLTPVDLAVGPETRFQPTPALLDAAAAEQDRPVEGLIVASPSNPAGSMLSPGELAALAGYCDRHGIRLISDEIYHGIVYDGVAATAAEFGDGAIVVNSFSKYFSMTGWRLGWMVLPADLLRAVECLAQNLFISPPTLPQLAALAVFDCKAELDANVARYRRNRDLLLAELPKAGLRRFAPPDGAFYLYADVGQLTNDSEAFCRRMLAETGVAATPGVDFDAGRGHRFLRLSFAGSTDDMAEAARRLRAWLG
jgi:aspartate/methionine/tyrosine aminotransferase